jgi:DNA excision repair protein ERCC-2
MIDSEISTAYKNRDATKHDLAHKIIDALEGMTGNYMVFFPSFEYMNQIMPMVSERLGADGKGTGPDSCRIVSQFPEMTENDKTEYLSAFAEASKGLLIGTAVLGGHFGEGIDLVGDRLSGVIIVGVGLPKVTPERQILLNYYTEKFGDGFAFAYRFPGWQKVLQAVGRVIRTEEDTGFALLIDSRLENPEYVMLFPDHWRI